MVRRVFRLLGDVEVAIDGRTIDAGHSRQRCVLVALLVDANRTVPVDHLIDRVWADRPPQRVRATLSGYVSRLRHRLGLSVDRRTGGYLLTVDPMTVDLHRFRHLVAQAGEATDDEAAAALLQEALELWRGEAFGALDTPWLTGVREALRTERLAAELDLADIALARGRHAPLLGTLSARADEHPLDERLAGQLMLALYRSGRQAEALDRYERVRRQLADELGADPSPPLQRLHRQILAADPALAVRSLVPHQLLAPLPSFTGRVRELERLDALLATPTPVAVLSGTAGVGKPVARF